MRLVTFLLWQARLRLVGFGQRVRDREVMLKVRTTWGGPDTRFARFVDRVSPFTSTGYKRVALRRLLYTVRFPILRQRFWSLALVSKIVYSLVPEPSLGRYEGSYYDPGKALKTEWLDDHTELAEDTAGDSDTYVWCAMFGLTPPWSLRDETWLLTVDYHGFVTAEQFPDWYALRKQFSDIEQRAPFFDNPEGDPTINGAFG